MSHEDEKKLRDYLLRYDNYANTKPYRIKVLKGDQLTMNLIQAVVASILKEHRSDPIQQFQSLRVLNNLAKDCIETFNDEFISQSQSTILPHVEKIAAFKREQQNEERGKTYFDEKPCSTADLAKLGKSFVRLSLECIWVWSKWFPVDPDTLQISAFKVAVEKLTYLGIKFAKIEYFDIEKVFKYIPESSVPIKILQECRNLVKIDLQNSRNGSPSKTLSLKLVGNIRKELANDEDEIFYSDKLKKALKKLKQQGQNQKCTKTEEVDVFIKQEKNIFYQNELLGQNKQSFNMNSPKTGSGNNNSIQESEICRQMQKEINKLKSENLSLFNTLSQKDKEIKDLRSKLHISNKRIANLESEGKEVDRSTSMIIGNQATPQVVYVSSSVRSKYISPSSNNSPRITNPNFQTTSLANSPGK